MWWRTQFLMSFGLPTKYHCRMSCTGFHFLSRERLSARLSLPDNICPFAVKVDMLQILSLKYYLVEPRTCPFSVKVLTVQTPYPFSLKNLVSPRNSRIGLDWCLMIVTVDVLGNGCFRVTRAGRILRRGAHFIVYFVFVI